MRQYDISGLTANLPFPHAFDGSLWTLIYEAIGYLTIAGLGFFALLKDKGKLVLGGVVLIYFIFLANIAVPGVAGKIFTPFRDIELITLLLFFLVGTAFYLFREKIIISNKFIVLTFLACVLGARYGFYTSIGPVLFSYFVLYMACKLPIMNFDKRADISYGIYIYAFPVQQLLSAKGINRYSYYVYTLSVCVITFALATLSYFCVERPFLRLKNVKIKGTSVAVRRFLQWERNQY
jgi:peptidoglycan/LPS O-acetylase OafA/YrhL